MPGTSSLTLKAHGKAPAPSHEVLEQLADIARQAPAPQLLPQLTALADRARSGGFYLACVGQFKRGKSTLINALVGEPLLPTGLLPVTSVPVAVRFGKPGARVLFNGDASWRVVPPCDLPAYVTEGQNPHNRKGVVAVEVCVAAPLLADGVCLVDTPGLGSVFAWNTAATHAFAPQIDALLIITGANPPMTGEELALLRAVGSAPIPRVLVFNKADRDAPAELDEAAAFTQAILANELGWRAGQVLRVSATEALAGQPGRDWPALVETIGRLAASSGDQLGNLAIARGFVHLRGQLQGAIHEARDALVRPLKDSEQRMASLRATAEIASRSLRELGPLLRMEEQQLGQGVAEQRAAFLAESGPRAAVKLEAELHASAVGRHRRVALDASVRVAEQHVLPWLESMEPVVEDAYDAAMGRMVRHANDVLDRLRDSDNHLAQLLPDAIPEHPPLSTPRQFYFLDYHQLIAPIGLEWLTRTLPDLCLPAGMVRRRITGAAHDLLRRLLDVNATRVQSDLADRVREGRLQLESSIRDQLAASLHAAGQAMARARRFQAAGAAEMADELARLDALLALLSDAA